LKCHLTKFTPGLGVGDAVHLFAGLQDMPATITGMTIGGKDATQAPAGSDCNVMLTTQKSIAYTKTTVFLLSSS